MDNVTQGSLTAGDVIYSDGNALQRLAAPGVPNNEALTFAAGATAPSWASSSGGTMQLVTSSVLTVDSNAMEFAILGSTAGRYCLLSYCTKLRCKCCWFGSTYLFTGK